MSNETKQRSEDGPSDSPRGIRLSLEFLDTVENFLARHDYYRNYRTRREAAFARGTMLGMALTLSLRLFYLLGTFVLAPTGSIGRAVLLPFLGSLTQCLLVSLFFGAMLALRHPRWMPIAGSLIAPLADSPFSDEVIEAVRHAWQREELWMSLDGVLRAGRAPRDKLGLPIGGDAIETIVAAENLEMTENAFACTTWYGPCDQRNTIWYSPKRETFSNAEPDLEGFRAFFSDEAIHTRWNSLPEAARRVAEKQKDILLSHALDYARGRRAALDKLGTKAEGLPMLAIRRLAADAEEFAVGLLLHEIGHLRLAAWCGSLEDYARQSRDWNSQLGKLLLKTQRVPLSLYSLVSPGEYFAEHYAAWRISPKSVSPKMEKLLWSVTFRRSLAA